MLSQLARQNWPPFAHMGATGDGARLPPAARYSHVRMEAKRKALEEIAARQIAADEKRQQEVERQQQATVVSPNQWCFSNRLPRTVGASSRAAVRGAKRNHSHLSYQRSMAADSRADRQIRMKAPKY